MAALAVQHYTAAHWERVLGHMPTPEQLKQIRDNENFELIPTNALLLETLLSNVEEIAELLLPRTWTLVSFAQPCLFSSEHPVIYINPSGEPGGYGVVTAEKIYLPLSVTRGLLLSHPWTAWPDAAVRGTDALARRLNLAVMALPTSERLLLHPDVEEHALPGPGDFAEVHSWPGEERPLYFDYLLRID
jgi:hypothetical protein